MKRLIAIPMVLFFAFSAWSMTNADETSVPILEEEYIEVEEVPMDERMEMQDLEEQRMEESRISDSLSEDGIDYSDRTRTNRERRAINTSSDASDDR